MGGEHAPQDSSFGGRRGHCIVLVTKACSVASRSLERAVHRRGRAAECGRRLDGGHVVMVAEHQRGELPARQASQRHEVRAGHRVVGDADFLGVLAAWMLANQVAAVVVVEGSWVGSLAGAAPDLVTAHVRRDASHPPPQRAPSLEPGAAAPGPDQCLLDGVLNVTRWAEHPMAVGSEVGAKAVCEFGEVDRTGGVGVHGAEPTRGHAVAPSSRWPWCARIRPCM